jgi:glycosyltransferase involved in cell wall biosynthesis
MILIDWGISSFYGWGVYGLNLALQWAGRNVEAATLDPINRAQVAVDPLRARAIKPFLAASALARVCKPRPGDVRFSCLGNECYSGVTDLAPGRNGVIFFEKPFSREAIRRAKEFDVIVAGSTWNADLLKSYGCTNVVTSFQGVDTSIFCPSPAPPPRLFGDRFVIFSGGKAEPRKGQDLVLKAFRAFVSRHPDALLVTAWASPWQGLARGMDLDMSGLEDKIIDIRSVPNWQMPAIYRACDVALFPNRSEGGTNLVAMEAIACGVPAIVSRNTGHIDLIDRGMVAYPLDRQSPSEEGIGESDVEEIVAALFDALHEQQWRPYSFDAATFSWHGAATVLEGIAEQRQRVAA